MAQLKNYRFQKNTLFPLTTRFRFAEVGKMDAQQSTDNLKDLKELILANQEMYPNIGRWYAEKVVPGLSSSERIAYVGFEDDRPIASAVLKLGDRSKFCHLRIHQNFQDMDLGQMFFTQMTLEVRRHAKEIHFTLPESLWCARSKFFEAFGFSSVTKASRQYRAGDTELLCSAPLSSVWSAVLSKLPHLLTKFTHGVSPLSNHILMSMKPKFAERILVGSKLIEIRKKFSQKWVGCRAVLYSSRPVSALVGEVTVGAVTYGRPSDVWSKFESNLGCSHEEFQSYVGSAEQVSAIEFKDVVSYQAPVSLTQLSHVVNEDLRPPQSFCDLRFSCGSPWTKATSFASLVHSRFGHIRPILGVSHGRETLDANNNKTVPS
jgi:predicted transcriptional regulator